jgi:hypothetical protein
MKITKKIHEKDTMTSEERLQRVINLQVPDRVPVAPLIYYFNSTYNNIPYASLYDPKLYMEGLTRIFTELGPWDLDYRVNVYRPEVFSMTMPMKMLEPGRELPPDVIRQFVEEEIMTVEDYSWLIEVGAKYPHVAYVMFLARILPRLWDTIPEGWRAYPIILDYVVRTLATWLMEFRTWAKRGVAPLYPFGVESAFDTFSMTRGIIDFVRDSGKYPDEIVKASDALTDSIVLIARIVCRLIGTKRFVIALHRSSNDFISPDSFRKLALPTLNDLLSKMSAHGIDCFLHCDGNWDLNMEALCELPAGRAIIQCDGASDIFKAKEIVGGRLCIMGDVPADMLVLGSPSEVDEYCHRLIEEVGKGGGFILGSGCEVPSNTKPENFKVMMESVVKYGYYHRS